MRLSRSALMRTLEILIGVVITLILVAAITVLFCVVFQFGLDTEIFRAAFVLFLAASIVLIPMAALWAMKLTWNLILKGGLRISGRGSVEEDEDERERNWRPSF